MGIRVGSGYIGSQNIETSVANQEIVPRSFQSENTNIKFYKFSFMNLDKDCTIKINNESPIFLKSNQGFSINVTDAPIHSFKILEDGITYNWVGAY